MTWCFNHRGPDYHWIVDLYERMNLPVLPEVVRAFQKATKERMTELEKKKTDEAKQKRVSQKIARSEDQEERKKWVKWQAILHTYGAEDEDDGNEENRTLVQEAEHLMGGEETVIVSGRKRIVWKWNVFYCNIAQPPPLLSRRIPEHRYIM